MKYIKQFLSKTKFKVILISNFLSKIKFINKNKKIAVETHGNGTPKTLNASNALNKNPINRIRYSIFLFFKIN